MLFCERDTAGKIVGIYARPQEGFAEEALTQDQAEGFLSLHLSLVPTVPVLISDRQFFQQLAIMGLISQEEAIAAVATGTLPEALAALIDQLPEEQRFAARMALQGATSFLRSNPLVETFGSMHGMTSTEIDDLWCAAAAL